MDHAIIAKIDDSQNDWPVFMPHFAGLVNLHCTSPSQYTAAKKPKSVVNIRVPCNAKVCWRPVHMSDGLS